MYVVYLERLCRCLMIGGRGVDRTLIVPDGASYVYLASELGRGIVPSRRCLPVGFRVRLSKRG
jgi:hypothetical protein